ncbi:MAG: hypothetical protein VKJ66_08665 [Synechococcus sp.]|nr:hypothetical protein [Synechococcus sp.]
MAPSGGKPPAAQGERRMIGVFSLVVGVALFGLILLRGQQAAREGNQELRNDTYWVLVSPLVFSGFGLYLLRAPSRGRFRAGGSRPAAGWAPGAESPAPSPLAAPEVQRRVREASLEAEQAQRALAAAEKEARQQLEEARQATSSAQARADAAETRLQKLEARTQERIHALEQELEQVRQARSRAEADLQVALEGQSREPGTADQGALVLRRRVEDLSRSLDQGLAALRQEQERALHSRGTELDALRQEVARARSAAEAAQQQETAAGEELAARLRQLEEERQRLEAALRQLREERARQAAEAAAAATAAQVGVDRLAAAWQQQSESLRQAVEGLAEGQGRELAEVRRDLETALAALEGARQRQRAAAEGMEARLVEMDQQIQEAQQVRQGGSSSLQETRTSLVELRGEAQELLEQSRVRVERLASGVDEQLRRAREDAAQALRTSKEVRELVDRLAQAATATPGDGAPGLESWGSSYQEACEELGVVPGSSWTVVRATWRRNLKEWHPDQGGDAERWMRRNAAYQLLVAWYEFTGSP